MSSISAMGPHFFHWKNKLWVRGGRSRLALSENIENYFFGAVNDRLIPSKPANLRDPYKIRFRTRDQGPGTRDWGPGTRDQGPGTRDQVPGTRDQGPGTRDQVKKVTSAKKI